MTNPPITQLKAPRDQVAAVIVSALLVYKGGVRLRHKALDLIAFQIDETGSIRLQADDAAGAAVIALTQTCEEIANIALSHPNLQDLEPATRNEPVVLGRLIDKTDRLTNAARSRLAFVAHQAANNTMTPISLFDAPPAEPVIVEEDEDVDTDF